MMARVTTISAYLLLGACLLLGGGTVNHLLVDLVLQLLAALLLVMGLARLQLQPPALSSDRRGLLWLAAGLALLMLLQFLPLPAALWGALPGRAELLANYQNLGLTTPGWLSWSTDPAASAAALRALLPLWALLVLGAQLDDRARRRLLWAVLLVALLSVPLGLAQIVQGSDSALRLYRPTNHHEAVGLFANRNHYAALLYVGLVLAVGFFLVFDRRLVGRGPTRMAHALGWLVLLTILLLGLLLSRSRAGVGLALVGLLASVLIGMAVNSRVRARWLVGAAAAIVLFAMVFGFDAFSRRLEADWLADNRWRVSAAALELAGDYGWLGSGAGTFPDAYAAFEPIDLVGDKIINHAHNDWFEWLVDLGIGFVLLLLGLLAWCWQRARALRLLDWRSESPLILSSALGLGLLAIHSAVDYPLRPTAMTAVAAALLLQLLQGNTPAAEPAPEFARRRRSGDAADQPRLEDRRGEGVGRGGLRVVGRDGRVRRPGRSTR